MKLEINSLPNRSIGRSRFFLNFGYHPTETSDLLCENKITRNKTVDSICKRMKVVWDASSENVKKSTELQAKYYNERHKMAHFDIGDLVLLNTMSLRLKGMSRKL